MTQLDKLETTLDDVFNKKAPFKLPADGRKNLAGALWWISLVFGLLELWMAWGFWHVGHWVDKLVDYANVYAPYVQSVQHLGFSYYLTLLVLAASAVLSLLAAPALKAMKKSGWDLLLYGLLLNLAYGVVGMFSYYGGFGRLFGAIISFVVGAFLLFQVREFFMKSAQTKK